MNPENSLILLERWRSGGDQDAAAELYERYSRRLIGLAKARLSPSLARRIDSDDVANSAARTFFCRIRDGRLQVQAGTDLWQLLAAITVRKALGQIEYHSAEKRAVLDEKDLDGSISIVPSEQLSREPDVAEVLALEDERNSILETMLPAHREIVLLKLQGLESAEISARVGLGQRMVNIVLSVFENKVRQRLAE